MALTNAQKQTIITVYIRDRLATDIAPGVKYTHVEMVQELGMLILNNPSTQQKAALKAFVQARKTASEAEEAALTIAPAQAALDAEQTALAAILTELNGA